MERERRKTAREDRLWNLIQDPTVKRLGLLSLIVGYSAYVTGKENAGRVETALAVALPTVGVPLLAVDAGVHDTKLLLALAIACGGIAAISSDKVVDAVSIEAPGGYPVLSLLGPIAGLRFVGEQLKARL